MYFLEKKVEYDKYGDLFGSLKSKNHIIFDKAQKGCSIKY